MVHDMVSISLYLKLNPLPRTQIQAGFSELQFSFPVRFVAFGNFSCVRNVYFM